MPIYEYRCAECGRTFEQLRNMRDSDRGVVCPECESRNVQRLLSGFSMAGCASKGGSRFT